MWLNGICKTFKLCDFVTMVMKFRHSHWWKTTPATCTPLFSSAQHMAACTSSLELQAQKTEKKSEKSSPLDLGKEN
jgi:hypothetical protein